MSSSYQPLPTSDDPPKQPFTLPTQQATRRKGLLYRFFAVLAIMSIAFFTLRQLSRSGLKNCHGMPKIHKNFSTLPSHYTLPHGDKIPSVALGVWKARRGEVGEAVKAALKAGYRHIDGAWIYGNEKEVGQAIQESGIPRNQIWLTSKLWNDYHEPKDIEPVLDESLHNLGTSYLDLYLIHWPIATNKETGQLDHNLIDDPYPTWQKMEEMVAKGKIRNIGVSNFNIRRIKNLTANPLKIKPCINQVELNYWNPQPDLLNWSKENGILLESYSPLGGSNTVKETLSVPEVKSIASELGITPAQVYTSWHVQRGTVVLPKSVTPSRIEENLQITLLPQEAFDKLEKSATSHKPHRSLDPSKSWGIDIFDEWDNDAATKL